MGQAMGQQKTPMQASLSAERSVLAILLRESELISDVPLLKPDHFASSTHAAIFEQLLAGAAAGQALDCISIHRMLKRAGWSEEVLGLAHLERLANTATSPASLQNHAQIVMEDAAHRQLLNVARRVTDIALEPGSSVLEKLERCQGEFDGIANAIVAAGPKPAWSVLRAHGEELRAPQTSVDAARLLPTGFPDLDAVIGGLRKKKVYYVGARPSMGKSAFALNVGIHIASLGHSVGIETLEMTNEEWVERSVGTLENANTQDFLKASADEVDWGAFQRAELRLNQMRLYLDDDPLLTLDTLVAKARLMKRRHGLDLLIIDQLQLMTGNEDTRQQMLGNITRGLKRAAKSLDIAILCLAALSREVERREDKRPILSDLRESGDIESDADVVLMLYREEYYDPSTKYPGLCECFVRKHRGGPLGWVPFRYVGAHSQFTKWDGAAVQEHRLGAAERQRGTVFPSRAGRG